MVMQAKEKQRTMKKPNNNCLFMICSWDPILAGIATFRERSQLLPVSDCGTWNRSNPKTAAHLRQFIPFRFFQF
jgi:hypothetical protein